MNKKLTIVVVLVLTTTILLVTLVPIKAHFARKSFKEALAFNKAKATISLKITPVFDGKPARADEMLVINLDNPLKSFEKFNLSPFKKTLTFEIPAKWLDVKFEGFDKHGLPIYKYKFLVRKYEVTLINTKDSLIGTKIVSIIPNKSLVTIPVEVEMRKTKFKKAKCAVRMLRSGYIEIEEYKNDIYGFTRIANLHSAPKERSQLVFPRGSVVYIQSKSRADSVEPLATNWSDAGPTATQITSYTTSGYEQDGSSSVIKMYAHYAYVRKKIVASSNSGTVATYEEVVFPLDSGGNGVANYHTSLNEPSKISGNKRLIGSGTGAQNNLDLQGVSGYYFTPAATLSFGANYGQNGGSANISLNLAAEAHYSQSPYVNIYIYGDNGVNNDLWAFDNGTNWGIVYFKWVKY